MFWRLAGVAVVVAAAATAVVFHRSRQSVPADLLLDFRAGAGSWRIADADRRFVFYLDRRYGSQTEYTNRATAFLDFFNPAHIRSLEFLVKHTPENMRQPNIEAAAHWVQQFRESLTPAQRADLCGQLQAGGGNSLLARATAEYDSQDVWYRGQTAPVISQLLKTIASAQVQPAAK